MSDDEPPFCGRECEFSMLIDKLRENTMIVIDAGTGRGVSSFAKDIKEKLDATIVIHRSDRRRESLRHLLIGAIVSEYDEKPDLDHEMNLFLDLEKHHLDQDRDYRKIRKICDDIRKEGDLPEGLRVRAKDLGESLINYFKRKHMSLPGEETERQYTVIIVDTADHMDESDKDLLERLVNSKHVRLVLVFRVIVNERQIRGYESAEPMMFSNPPADLIKKLFEGMVIDENEAEELAEELERKRDVQKIMHRYWDMRGGFCEPDEYEECILTIVSLCETINTEDLEDTMLSIFKAEDNDELKSKMSGAIERRTNCRMIPLSARELKSKMSGAIERLRKKELIEIGNGRISLKRDAFEKYSFDELTTWITPSAEYFLERYMEQYEDGKKDIHTAETVRRILTHKKADKYPPMEELIKGYRIDHSHCSRTILKCKLRTGMDIKDDDYKFIKDKPDKELKILALCRQYKYEEALNEIEEEELHKKNEEYGRLRAVLLNRTYKLHASLIELNTAYVFEDKRHVRNLLASYIIATYIHLERLDEAKSFFESHCRTSADENLGYVLRNAASAETEPEKRIPLYKKAEDLFKDRDEFGTYTTKSGRGYALTLMGEKYLNEGHSFLKTALEGLTKMGERDRCIVYNNMGINLLYQKDGPDRKKECIDTFYRAHNFQKTSMQKYFLTINEAYFFVSIGEYEKAKKHLETIRDEVKKFKVDRVRQQYYPARALVAYCISSAISDKEERELELTKLKDCIIESEKPENRNRYSEDKVKSNNEAYREYLEDDSKKYDGKWQRFCIPCGLFYWYVDPLRFLSQETIDKIIS